MKTNELRELGAEELEAKIREARKELAAFRLRVASNAETEKPARLREMRRNIARTAAIVERENRLLDALAGEYLPADGCEIPCDSLRSAPEALQPRIVRLLLERLGAGKKDISALHLEAVVQLSCRTNGGMVSLPGGIAALCREDRLKFSFTRALPERQMLAEGMTQWGGYELQVRYVDDAAPRREAAIYLAVPAEGALSVDSWHSGDGLTLPNSRGRRSIKRLLTERGVESELRRYVPCIRVDEQPAAVYGVGVDEAFMPGKTGMMIEITIRQTE